MMRVMKTIFSSFFMTSFMKLRCTRGPVLVQARAYIGSREGWHMFLQRMGMGTESQAVSSARVTKHFVTIFSKTCNKTVYILIYKS